jgi:uncharacterized protein YggE
MMRKSVIAISLVAIVVLGVFLYYFAVPRISVSGTGTVNATPDQGQIAFTVRIQDVLAANAVSKQAAIMDRVLAGLTEQGIAKEAITTSAYSLNPVYNQTEYCKEGYCVPVPVPTTTSGKIIGYEVIQSIQVTVDDLPRVGNVIDKIVQAGVSQIDYIGFSFKDTTYNSLRAQAYKKAVADARGQADAIVGATGGFVIGIASLSTNYWGPIYTMEKRDVSGGTVPPSTPVVPQGSITVTAQVNIVYLYL